MTVDKHNGVLDFLVLNDSQRFDIDHIYIEYKCALTLMKH
jgi:hypothetical protein